MVLHGVGRTLLDFKQCFLKTVGPRGKGWSVVGVISELCDWKVPKKDYLVGLSVLLKDQSSSHLWRKAGLRARGYEWGVLPQAWPLN